MKYANKFQAVNWITNSLEESQAEKCSCPIVSPEKTTAEHNFIKICNNNMLNAWCRIVMLFICNELEAAFVLTVINQIT